MARIDDLIEEALKTLPVKPPDSAAQSKKKRYSELVSEVAASAVAAELRHRGMKGARPSEPGLLDKSGAERRMSGGIGAKKVDVTWSTEESGLLASISVKSINFRDKRSGNFQKNLTNRRGDMLFESVTLHRRFPYAVMFGLFFLDRGAAEDDTDRRKSTFLNAHDRLKMFSGRADPYGRDEQYEKMYLLLLDASPTKVWVEAYEVGEPENAIPLEHIMDSLVRITAERNSDFYQYDNGNLKRV